MDLAFVDDVVLAVVRGGFCGPFYGKSQVRDGLAIEFTRLPCFLPRDYTAKGEGWGHSG